MRVLSDFEELQLTVASLNRETEKQEEAIKLLATLADILGKRIDVCDREIDKIKQVTE